MPRRSLALFVILAGCTPAQQRTTGAVVAAAGVVTMFAGAAAMDRCTDASERQWRNCPQIRPPRYTTGAGVAVASGAGVTLVGGLIYLTSYASRQRRPADTTSPPPTAAPAPIATTSPACSSSDYRAYQASQLCGFSGARAVCKVRPLGCSDFYAPVCGCDLRTYPNACKANAAGTDIYAAGHCPR